MLSQSSPSPHIISFGSSSTQAPSYLTASAPAGLSPTTTGEQSSSMQGVSAPSYFTFEMDALAQKGAVMPRGLQRTSGNAFVPKNIRGSASQLNYILNMKRNVYQTR